MKIKRRFRLFSCLLLAITFLLTSVGCATKSPQSDGVSSSSTDTSTSVSTGTTTSATPLESHSLLVDPLFKNGFTIKGLGGTQGTTNRVGYFPSNLDTSKRIHWNLAQWMARYSFVDPSVATETNPSEGVYAVETPSEIFAVDTNTGLLTFNCKASACYDAPRVGNEGWMHLLIETDFYNGDNWNKVSELSSLVVSMDTQLTKFEDHMGDAFNGQVHAAQFLLYLVMANRNPESKDYGRYIWFGLGMFDNRTEHCNGGAMLDKGTGAMMYGVSTEKSCVSTYRYRVGNTVRAGTDTPWVSYRYVMFLEAEIALRLTQYNGYLRDTTMDDLYFTGMNMGWEVPGTYDVEMLVKNFNVVAQRRQEEK